MEPHRKGLAFSIYEVPVSSIFYNGPSRPMNFYHHDAINEAMTGLWTHTSSSTFLNEAPERRGLALERNQLKSSSAMGLAHGQLRQYRTRESENIGAAGPAFWINGPTAPRTPSPR